jgi:hypothetical protein
MMSKERELLRKLFESGILDRALTTEVGQLLAQPEHTEQEPVAWMYDHLLKVGHDKYTNFNIIETCVRNLESDNCINVRPLYLAPPKREPIEDGELEVWYSQHAWAMDKQEYMWGFRDAEKCYGIGGGK